MTAGATTVKPLPPSETVQKQIKDGVIQLVHDALANGVQLTQRSIIGEFWNDVKYRTLLELPLFEDYLQAALARDYIAKLYADNKLLKMEIENIAKELAAVKSRRKAEAHVRLKKRLEAEEILESLELDGVQVERFPKTMHPTETPSWRCVSPSALAESCFSSYSHPTITNYAKIGYLRHFEFFGRVFLDAFGVTDLMEREAKSLAGELKHWGLRIGEHTTRRQPKVRHRQPVGSRSSS